LAAPDQRGVALGITASAGGHELSHSLAKVETAIFRHKTITFEYFTMERGELGLRTVDPYHLLFRGGQFYLLGYAHEREALRVFRLSRIRGKVAYATKAEHDFRRPADFDPRAYANLATWQFGDITATAEIRIAERVAWLLERHFGRHGEIRPIEGSGDRLFVTDYANDRQLISWVLGLGENAQVLAPPELAAELRRRLALLVERHEKPPAGTEHAPEPQTPSPAGHNGNGHASGRADAAIRPERFARLVTLASILIQAGRAGSRLAIADVCERLQISDGELREDIGVLNVVNFGGGSYVLYAEIDEQDATIEVDPEPYSDNFARPARLLPVEAKALVAAIDLIGEHLPQGSLTSARAKIVRALGEDPMEQGLQVAHLGTDDSAVTRVISKAIKSHVLLELDYYKENEDEYSARRVEPYALINGREGWYVATFDPEKGDVRHFRLDRVRRAELTGERFVPRPEVNPSADVDGWPRTGEVSASRTARVWISPERARWAREQRKVVGVWDDGSIAVELSFAGVDWLVREVLKEAGDAAVLEPPDARAAVLAAAARIA
jgi:proteasome accessory factor C